MCIGKLLSIRLVTKATGYHGHDLSNVIVPCWHPRVAHIFCTVANLSRPIAPFSQSFSDCSKVVYRGEQDATLLSCGFRHHKAKGNGLRTVLPLGMRQLKQN